MDWTIKRTNTKQTQAKKFITCCGNDSIDVGEIQKQKYEKVTRIMPMSLKFELHFCQTMFKIFGNTCTAGRGWWVGGDVQMNKFVFPRPSL